MKSADLWQQYKEYTETLSVNSRKLGFAAVGIFWVLNDRSTSAEGLLLWALVASIGFFLADLLQYAVSALLIHRTVRAAEVASFKDTGSLGTDVEKPAWTDRPAQALFVLKTTLLVVSYCMFLAYLLGNTESPAADGDLATRPCETCRS